MAEDPAAAAKLLTALKHPTRRAILREMITAKGPISPTQVADAIAEPLNNVTRHVRVLLVPAFLISAGETRTLRYRGCARSFEG